MTNRTVKTTERILLAGLKDSDERRIQQAMDAAGAQIDGELVTIIASVSDTYRWIPTVWTGLLTLLAPG
jgi:putative membrane protein